MSAVLPPSAPQPQPQPESPPAPHWSPLDEANATDEAAKGKRRHFRPKRGPWNSVIEWVVIIGIALLGALLIRTVLFQAYYIPSASMEPTLELHDRILVNKLSYDFHSVHRGDVVVFSRNGLRGIDEGNIKDLVKRVIGLPGDTIQSTPDGQVEVNGKILTEHYLPAGTLTFNLPKTVVPAGHYWVMGDNRGDSADSRVFGPIAKNLIVGRAFVLIWPLSRLGTL